MITGRVCVPTENAREKAWEGELLKNTVQEAARPAAHHMCYRILFVSLVKDHCYSASVGQGQVSGICASSAQALDGSQSMTPRQHVVKLLFLSARCIIRLLGGKVGSMVGIGVYR